METIKQKLGKVSITVDKDEHSIDKEYDKLVVVYKKTPYTETVDGETVTKYNYRTYISRKPVPIGKEITNKDYWIQLGSVEEHIVLDYETFKAQVNAFLNSFVAAENARVLAENNRISNETSRVEQENIRETQETTRKEHEDARILAEKVRQQQEGSPADEPDRNGSRWARYKKAEQVRDSSYSDKEDNRDASYTSNEQTRNDSYNTAEGKKTDTPNLNGSRWAQYKAKENKRQQDYEANEGHKDLEPNPDGSRWEKYKDAEQSREYSFKESEDSRDTTFNNSEESRQNTFNVNEGTVNDTPSSTGSRWAIFKFNEASRQTAEQTRVTNESNRQTQETARQQAESQRTSTFNQSQAERQQAYQNAEGTSSDEPSATGSRWARYNKAEQDRNAAIEDLKENKANKDGYYSQMTVGSAENLVGQTVDSEAYLIRPTGGESNEVANGVASILGMEGNSAVWNQLYNVNGYLGYVGCTGSVSNNILTCTISTVAASTRVANTLGALINNTHTKLFTFSVNPQKDTSIAVYSGSEYYKGIGCPANKWTDIKYLRSKADTDFDIALTRSGNMTVGDTVQIKGIKVIDLTLLGIDNLTTVAEVEAWLAQHVGTKPYYAYNAGTILSAQTLGIKTYGQNLLNPTTRQAKLIPYEWEDNSNVYTIKNVPSGATATFTPDATGVAETVDVSGGSLDITSYGSGILELSAATSETYVCMKWDEGKDDDVVPYEEHTHNFDVRKVYGKVNGAGEYVQCFPEGMRSDGSAHDTLTAASATKVIGDVNLGSLDWGGSSVFYSSIIPDATIKSGITCICSKYEAIPNITSSSQVVERCIAFNSQRLYCRDSNYSTAADFKTAVNSVPLYYELATPITYTDLVYRDGGIDRPLSDTLMDITVNNWSIEEQLLTPYDENGNPTSIPATIKTQYGMDAVEAIDTLQNTCYFADDVKANLQALLTCINTNCAETLGGTFAISNTATDKVFAFTFTPNTEPDVEPTNEGE